MRKTTLIALIAGGLALAGAVAAGTFALAHNRADSQHWRHASHRDGGPGWHRGYRHGGGRMLMERFDTDKDGKLTQAELDAARKDLLARHDADKNGRITLKEFETLWLEVTRKRMVRGYQRLDEDGSGEITGEEFLKPFATMVERLDRNDDGVLDKADRKARWMAPERDTAPAPQQQPQR